MRNTPRFLLNTADIELWPSTLLRARSNADARILAQSDWTLRRKRDGRYLAARLPHGLMPLVPRLPREPGLDQALDLLDDPHATRRDLEPALLPPTRLLERLQQLNVDADAYAARTGLELIDEPARLSFAGRDRYRRPLWLTTEAGRHWQQMRAAAADDSIVLDAISGYRSHDYQMGIFERKLQRGLSVSEILAVNAAPGYSEHHSGNALDIGAPGEPPAEESFERTLAFAWLHDHAASFGFHLSFPRDNPHGIVYEPWHWCWQPEHQKCDGLYILKINF